MKKSEISLANDFDRLPVCNSEFESLITGSYYWHFYALFVGCRFSDLIASCRTRHRINTRLYLSYDTLAQLLTCILIWTNVHMMALIGDKEQISSGMLSAQTLHTKGIIAINIIHPCLLRILSIKKVLRRLIPCVLTH